jgi:hypothetical protein
VKPSKDSVVLTEHAVIQAGRFGMDWKQHEYGLYGMLLDMVSQAAPLRDHPKGNYRFEEWVLDLTVEGVLRGVHLIKCDECLDRHRTQMWDECLRCGGADCRKCHGKGRVQLWIPCGSCSGG